MNTFYFDLKFVFAFSVLAKKTLVICVEKVAR